MNIVELSKKRENQYTDFIESHEYTLFYYSLGFRDLVSSHLDCQSKYLLALEDEKITGILPLMLKKGKYGIVANSLPFFGSNGGVISKSLSAKDELISYYNKLACSEGILASTIIENPIYDNRSINLDFDFEDSRIGQITELQDTEGNKIDILSNIDSSARRNVKKALKNKISVKRINDNQASNFLSDIHNKNMTEIGGLVKDISFFDSLPKHLNESHDYNIYVAFYEDKPIAALLLFYFNQTVEYYTPAIVEEFRSLQPLALIIFEAMTEAMDQGYKYWNWGGTHVGMDGVYRFKKKWDAKDRPYKYFTKLNNRQVLDLPIEELLKEYPNFYVLPFTAMK